MKKPILIGLVATVMPLSACAGTLDHAPFRVSLPSTDWALYDSAPLGEGTDIVATLNNSKTNMSSFVGQDSLKRKTIEDLINECRTVAKDTSERHTTFLGFSADQIEFEDHAFRHFADGSQSIPSYCIKIFFVVDGVIWSISCSVPLEHKEECRRILSFYHPK